LEKPFKPILADLVYADVEGVSDGAALPFASEEKVNAEGVPPRPPRETRL